MRIEYRKATTDDFTDIQCFVDFWLSGRGKSSGKEGVVNDYFISWKQHLDYLKSYCVLLALRDKKIVGWAVKNHHNVLTHLLVAGDCRGKRIGSEMIRLLKPEIIRSKTDQSTGDPGEFYIKLGYVKIPGERIGRKKNIELYQKS